MISAMPAARAGTNNNISTAAVRTNLPCNPTATSTADSFCESLRGCAHVPHFHSQFVPHAWLTRLKCTPSRMSGGCKPCGKGVGWPGLTSAVSNVLICSTSSPAALITLTPSSPTACMDRLPFSITCTQQVTIHRQWKGCVAQFMVSATSSFTAQTPPPRQ